ncbi:MAG: hypothetical protein RRB22_04220 [Gammaproteobacteria bacterium]|nr:hypothetical protein [Gammaproteobacteria bacterium]
MNKMMLTILLVIVATIATLFFAPLDTAWISAIIALVALMVSLISAFKDEIFPFRLTVLCDEIILAPTSAASHDSLALIFPFVFINDGNGSGVVERLSIKVESADSVKLYAPLSEIDYGVYISGKRRVHAESIIGAFGAFPLQGKESIQKHILFSQAENSEKYPFNTWNEDTFKIRVFVKCSNTKKPKELVCFNRQITKTILDNYKSGIGASVVGNRELDI